MHRKLYGIKRYWLWGVFLFVAAAAATVMKSLDVHDYPYLLDGDPYFHANVIRYITEHWRFPEIVPNQIPTTGIFYPMGFHLLYAILVKLTGLSEFQLLRWGGPVTAGLLTVSMFFLALRLWKNPRFIVTATILTALVPIFTQRLSITLPENIFLLCVVWALFTSTFVFSKPTLRNVTVLSVIAGLGLFVHFSGYILGILPIVGWSYFLWLKIWHRKYWQFILMAGLLAGGFWLVLFLRPELWTTIESFSNRSVANPEFMAQPPYRDWLESYGWLTMIFLFIGLYYVIRLKDRRWWGVFIWAIASVAFIDLLPRFNLYNLLPFRGFPYLALAIIPIAAAGIVISSIKVRWSFPFIVVALLLSLPIRPAGWDKDVTRPEYEAMHNLGRMADEQTNKKTLIITQPINGRPITYFTKIDTISDAAVDMLKASNAQTFLAILKTLGQYDNYFVYISKYKLGRTYNRGWNRPWAVVDLNQKLFWNDPMFLKVYENADAIIFRLRGA